MEELFFEVHFYPKKVYLNCCFMDLISVESKL